jgi:hypothetical protein
MKKLEMMIELKKRHVEYRKSWNKTQLLKALSESMGRLRVIEKEEDVNPGGNWNTAKDWFPSIEVDQTTMTVVITEYNSSGHQKKASISTEWITVDMSDNGDAIYIRGEVDCRNWINYKCSRAQQFCFAVFIGDSGHIYTHRAPATKGWMNGHPNDIRKRLRKLGIGSDTNVVQQGDFLLKPANGNAEPDEEFKHETTGAGHHNFEMPVLYAYSEKSRSRQYKITEPTRLIHTAVDGIKHPDIIVQPGVWVVGTTANQLRHGNARD